jgi:hypothetical protein
MSTILSKKSLDASSSTRFSGDKHRIFEKIDFLNQKIDESYFDLSILYYKRSKLFGLLGETVRSFNDALTAMNEAEKELKVS